MEAAHKLLDVGALGITLDRRIAVSLRFVGRGDVAEQLVSRLMGRELEAPQGGLPGPADSYIEWHRTQVFRTPSRMTV